MTKEVFKNFISDRIVFLDGATGINLIKAGMPSGVCPEAWILEHPKVIESLHNDYIAAGSEIVYAPTFTGNRVKLAEYGLEDKIAEINTELASLCVKNAAGRVLVAADVTMTGKLLKPQGDMELEELIDIYKEQIGYLARGGVDLVSIETMTSLAEARAALIAASEICDLPVIVTMTFEENGRTLYGSDARTVAVVLESLGAAAIGVNCAAGPLQMVGIIREMASVSKLPIIAKPNAGMPVLDAGGKTVYNMDAKTFAFQMEKLVEAGAAIIGGCCGTTPEFIRELKAKFGNMTPQKRKMTEIRHISSEKRTISFGLNDPFIMVGERINPTGKKKLKEELKEGKFDQVLAFAEEQEAAGALILDVNLGMEGIDETNLMRQAISLIAAESSLPLSIDSSHAEVIETALRHYSGRALINSVSLEKVKIDNILPLAKKYGAMFILLPLSDRGLPAGIDEKIAIIEEITARALALGIPKQDIIVDALVTAVGANKNAANEALETIRYCQENGYATTCGLSNISFGLPERGFINAAFLTMAINSGLTMAILNPDQSLLVNSALAADMLLNRDGADLKYIDQVSQLVIEKKSGAKQEQISDRAAPIARAVLKGQRSKIIELTQTALDNGVTAREILDNQLLPAIDEVGKLFDSGIYFLPQLIGGAETMKAAIDYLEPLLGEDNKGAQQATIVIATVAGDIHDIGKNIVAMMLKNHGFNVIDLGKDVAAFDIIAAAAAHQADFIALSALMTTTMTEMKTVINLAEEKGIRAKIIVGGAVITNDYALSIGAGGYAKDAAEAVRLIKKLVNN